MKLIWKRGGGDKKDRHAETTQNGEGKMKDIFASKIRDMRRERGMSQEQLASVCGVSVQAVSKWECGQSYPDIELLEVIADTFNVTIDSLLRESAEACAVSVKKDGAPANEESVDDRLLAVIAEKFGVSPESVGRVDVRMSTGDDGERTGEVYVENDLPDDDVLRVVQYRGRRCLDSQIYDPHIKIPLILEGVNGGGVELKIEVWGSTELELSGNSGLGVSLASGGDIRVSGEPINGSVAANGNVAVKDAPINGGVAAGGNVNVSEGCINGSVTAGGDVDCDDGINGAVSAGGSVECEDVSGSVSAGGSIDCGDVGGSASSGGNLNCGDVGGSASSGGNMDCGDVGGDVNAGGPANCGDVGGDVNAGDTLGCGDVGGDVNAGGDVDCGDVDGNVDAEGDVDCGDVDGDVNAEGDVDCGDVGGDVYAGGSASFGDVEGILTNDGGGDCNKRKEKGGRINADFDIDLSGLSNLGEYVSRTVSEAMEAAFGNKNKGKTVYDNGDITVRVNDENNDVEDDPMLIRALELAVESGRISTSIIQRHLSLGYGRASKLIDRMEALGYISAADGQRPRDVLITRQQLEELKSNGQN